MHAMKRTLFTTTTALAVLLAATGCEKASKCLSSNDAAPATTAAAAPAPAPVPAPAYPAPTAYAPAPAPAYPAPPVYAPAPAQAPAQAPAPAPAAAGENTARFLKMLRFDSDYVQYSDAQLLDMGHRTCAAILTVTGSRPYEIETAMAAAIGLPNSMSGFFVPTALDNLCPQYKSKWPA